MPSSRKKQIVKATRKRQRRGAIYLTAIIVIITTIGIGWYVYASSQSQQSNTLPDIVYAKLNTTQGPMEFELYHNLTPKTVENFVSLAKSGFYNHLVWHRIMPSFVIQTGDPNTRYGGGDRNTWGQGTSGTSVPFENVSSLHNDVSYVAMASTGAGVGGTCQFYINVNPNSASLDGKWAVFGKVISGMDTAYKLANLQTTNQYPNAQNQPSNPADAMLISVTISNSP